MPIVEKVCIYMWYKELNNGVKIPMIGLGTWPMNRGELVKATWSSLWVGYSHFDTSESYGNELWLGRALRFYPKSRNKIFISSKLSNRAQRQGDVLQAYNETLKRLGVSFLDLYLMHWPNPDTYLSSWKKMEDIYLTGKVRAIGVCNFHEHHIRELLKNSRVVPVINQIELHPLLSQASLVRFCQSQNIAIESYSPVARMHPKLIQHPYLIMLSAKYCKTVPQIVIRWNLQHGYTVIPKTSHYLRLKENYNVFDFMLQDNEMYKIDELNENFRIRHNPDTCDYSKL